MKTLTWKVSYTRPTACPDYKPDPYTGQYPSTHCLVYHCETITESKSAEFETDEEVNNFISKAHYTCHEFKLDGRLLVDIRPQQNTGMTYSTNLVGNDTTTISGSAVINTGGLNKELKK